MQDKEQPQWRAPAQLGEPLLAKVRSWLLDDGSLTQRLIDTGLAFSLQRWQQGWESPHQNERRLLAMGLKERAIVRSVVLQLDSQPVVFARSVFPASSLTGPLLRLRKLQNQSLGALLFARTDMRRSPFEVARLPGNSAYLPACFHQNSSLWARRSRFLVAGRPLLVSEVFLDQFPPWQASTHVHRSRRGLVDATIGR